MDWTRLRQLATQLGDLHEQEMKADKVSMLCMQELHEALHGGTLSSLLHGIKMDQQTSRVLSALHPMLSTRLC